MILTTLEYLLYERLLMGFYNGLGPINFITLIAFLAAFVSVYSVWRILLVRDPLSGRARTLKRYREDLQSGLTRPQASAHRKVAAVGFMSQVIQRLNLMRSRHAAKTAKQLMAAGWRSKEAIVTFLFFKICLPAVFGISAVLFLYVLGSFNLSPLGKLFTSLALVLLGFYAPDIYVHNQTQKRRKELQKGLPDALDLLVVCSEAGLGIDAALARVARELGKSSPEVADEFGVASVELGFLPERRKALENLAERANIPAIRGIVNTLMQTEKYGTPLANSLRVLSQEFREERMLKAEEKAAKLPATLMIPLILFILPTLFVVILGPAVLRIIDGLGGLL